jgi:hypothetical protein
MDGDIMVVSGFVDCDMLMLVMGVVMVCRCEQGCMVVSDFMVMLAMDAVVACGISGDVMMMSVFVNNNMVILVMCGVRSP